LNPKNAFNYSTNKPIFLENNINGLPAIKFSKDYGNCMSVESGFDNNTENVTIFVVLVAKSVNFGGRIIEKWSDGTGPYPYVLRQNFFFAIYSGQDGGSRGTNLKNGNSSGVVGVPYVVSARRIKSVNLSIWLNGAKQNDAQDNLGVSTINSSHLYIGCQGYNSGIGYGDFNVGEIIIYSRALSDVEILRVNQYLSQKWNIKF
jgi:hypothetical protein